ncbi:MAG: hypothetical protein O2947_04545 [Bacteroidetes bacterium]|nr:hypothetical protein [Bacteroidota bacterium]
MGESFKPTHVNLIKFDRHLFLAPVGLWGILLCLTSCEGATYVNQHFINNTQDTLHLGVRIKESQTGWSMDTLWHIPPGAIQPHYAVDRWGKCSDCTEYETAPFGLDTIWLENDTLNVSLMDPTVWVVVVDEGVSWIEFDHQLSFWPFMFD